jgi:hypothetical protein
VFLCDNKPEYEVGTVPDANDRKKPTPKVDQSRPPGVRSIWRISYIKGKLHERRTKYEAQTPEQKAAQRTANATVWIAAFTIVLAIVGWITLYEVVAGGTDTREAFRQEQRAWVGVVDGETIDFAATRPWFVKLTFLNSGRTPARNVRVSRLYRTTTAPILGPPVADIKDLEFRPAHSIAPQSKFVQFIGGSMSDTRAEPGYSSHATQELIDRYDAIKSRRLFLYYYGIVKYDDIFGRHWETQYCIFLANPHTGAIAFCDTFNDLN